MEEQNNRKQERSTKDKGDLFFAKVIELLKKEGFTGRHWTLAFRDVFIVDTTMCVISNKLLIEELMEEDEADGLYIVEINRFTIAITSRELLSREMRMKK